MYAILSRKLRNASNRSRMSRHVAIIYEQLVHARCTSYHLILDQALAFETLTDHTTLAFRIADTWSLAHSRF